MRGEGEGEEGVERRGRGGRKRRNKKSVRTHFYHLAMLFSQSGDVEIINHTTGDKCALKWRPYKYFNRENQRKVD